MAKEKTIEQKQKISRASFWTCLGISIFLMVGSALFPWPPTFIIEPSIFEAVGWLFGFAALGQLPDILMLGRTAKIQRGNTVVTIGKDENNDGYDDDWQRQQDRDNADALDD